MKIQYWRCMVCWEMSKYVSVFSMYGGEVYAHCSRPNCGGVYEAVR